MRSSESLVKTESEYFLHTASEGARRLFFYPTVIGKYDYLAGYHLVRSRYDSFLILMVDKGRMELTLGGKSIPVSTGSIALIDCYAPHEYTATEDTSTLWIHFDGPFARAYFDAIRKERGSVHIPSDFRKSYTTLLRLFAAFQNGRIPGEAALSLTITSLLGEMLDTAPTANASPRGIPQATAYISEHFSQKVTLEELSDLAGFSPYYFTRLFKKETGLTPHQYLISTRLSAARYMLGNTGLSVAEVATSCGFEDESAFISTFRKWEGITPAKYRKTH